MAVIEDKPTSTRKLGVGAEQVKEQASLLGVKCAYVAKDEAVIEYDMITGKESEPRPLEFPTPDELWEKSQKQYDAFSPGPNEWPALIRRCDAVDPSYKE